MIVWDTLTIANAAGSITLTYGSNQLISSQCIRAPEFRAHGSGTLYGYLTGDHLILGEGSRSISCTITKDEIQMAQGSSVTTTLSTTGLVASQVTANNITVSNTITAASANITSSLTASVNKLTCQMPQRSAGERDFIDFLNPSSLGTNGSMKLGNDNSAQLYLTTSNIRISVPTLDITSSLKYNGANFPTVSTQQITTISYAVAEASSQWRRATENGVLTVVNFFDRVYDIYFQLCREEDGIQNWVNGEHVDAWWRIELPSAVKNLFNNATIIDSDAREKSAYKWEDGHAYATLDGYKTQWQTRYVLSGDMTTAYIYLGIDSHSSFEPRRVSSVAHYRLIKTV